MEWTTVLIIMLAIIIPLTLTGLPIAVVLLATGIILLAVSIGPQAALYSVVQNLYEFWSNWSVLAIPLFVLMGEMLFVGGSAQDIFNMVSILMRRVRGGLAMVSVGACAIFASMCGSSAGATSTMAIVCIPEMIKRGYNPKLATGAIAGAGALAHMIPPSMLMVVYASLVEISPGRALMAAVLPGLLLAVFYGIVVGIWTLVDPHAAPKEPDTTVKEKFKALTMAWQPVVLIIAVMGTLYLGIATATEAAAFGAFVALIMALAKTRGKLGKIGKGFADSARISCFIMFIASSGTVLGMMMTNYLIPMRLADFITGSNLSPWLIMVLIQVLFFFLGMFLSPIGMMVITLPILAPLVTELGFDLYWFGVMLMVNFEIALVTPPMAPQLYIIKGVMPEIPLSSIFKGGMTFLIAPVAMLIAVGIFPQIALWLPGVSMGR